MNTRYTVALAFAAGSVLSSGASVALAQTSTPVNTTTQTAVSTTSVSTTVTSPSVTPVTVHNPMHGVPAAGGFTISGLAWGDVNGNGIQDTEDKGIANISLTIINSEGSRIGTAVTNADGKYAFSGVETGDYRLTAIPPQGTDFTVANAGDDTKDSDMEPGGSAPIHVSGDMTVDVGFKSVNGDPIPTAGDSTPTSGTSSTPTSGATSPSGSVSNTASTNGSDTSGTSPVSSTGTAGDTSGSSTAGANTSGASTSGTGTSSTGAPVSTVPVNGGANANNASDEGTAEGTKVDTGGEVEHSLWSRIVEALR